MVMTVCSGRLDGNEHGMPDERLHIFSIGFFIRFRANECHCYKNNMLQIQLFELLQKLLKMINIMR